MTGESLGLEPMPLVADVQCYLRLPWPRIVLLGLVAAAVVYVVLLYRRERTLSAGRRIFLGALRALILALLIVLLFEPMLVLERTLTLPRTLLVLLDTSESMGIRDARTIPRELEAPAPGQVPQEGIEALLTEAPKAQTEPVSRIELAKEVLATLYDETLPQLRPGCEARYFQFGERLEPSQADDEAPIGPLQSAEPTGKVTRLGSAVEEAPGLYAGQRIAGVILLTDGASNDGSDPLEAARRMGERGVPLYPIGLGRPDPPDVHLRELVVQDTVFHRDKVPVRFCVSSTGYRNRAVNLSVVLDGQKVAGMATILTGGLQFEELVFVPEGESGARELEVVVSSPTGEPKEVSLENNKRSKLIRVIDEKIRVLYVEGRPRWEYRYLRQVLLRDHRLDVKFLLTEGDPDLAATSDRYLVDFPQEAAATFHYDLVILGDVRAAYFSREQLARMEELVRERGGSLLMLAGHRYAPSSYLGTPIAKALPIVIRTEASWLVADEVYPVVTPAGNTSAVTSLEFPSQRNQEVWSLVKPMSMLPVLEGPKPGATVLAGLSAGLSAGSRFDASYPLIVWQRYGTGKSLFVGTDQLWRLRFKRGDKYHARFWGQAIQFLTLSRLLGENKSIQLGTDRKDYRTGERVQVTANVLTENFEPVADPSYTVYVDRLGPRTETTPLQLEPVPNIAGLFQGFLTLEQAGSYRVRTAPAQASLSNSAEFRAEDTALEKLDPAMQEELLRRMAELSGGRYLDVNDLPSIPETLGTMEPKKVTVRRLDELWDQPLLFGLILILAGVEWVMRRRYDLL